MLQETFARIANRKLSRLLILAGKKILREFQKFCGFCFQYSTSVELESVSVAVYLSVSNTLWAAWSLQKWSDLAEILHISSLSEYLGFFILIFQKFKFLGIRDEFSPKRG